MNMPCPSICIFADLNEEWRETRNDQLDYGTFGKFHPTETSIELPNLFLYIPVYLSKEKNYFKKSNVEEPVK